MPVSNDIIASIGLILLIISCILMYLLYSDSEENFLEKLGLKGWFIRTHSEIKINNKVVEESNGELLVGAPNSADVFKKKPDKEVFNIDDNDFTYRGARLACEALDSRLATYAELVDAHKKGANWCNYGWSANGMALYPIQKAYYKTLKKKGCNKKCGKPGVNGGFFQNKNLKFGVNCYGNKPKPDDTKIVFTKKKCNQDKDIIDKYRNDLENGTLNIRPFSKQKWSAYSNRTSRYLIPPRHTNISRSKTHHERDVL